MRSLAELLTHPRADDAPVAFGRDGVHTWVDFTERVEGLSRQLAGRGAAWLVDCTDSFAFAVALFAIARAGAVGWLPPNRQPGTLRDLAAACDGTLRDDPSPEQVQPNRLVLDPLAFRAPASAAALDPRATVLRLFTSGTAGQAKEIPKAWCHLDEVAELERRFGGALAGDARVFSTAPHQHLYGLLFRVLWPLAAGRPFQADPLLHAEELLPRLAEPGASVLAATPAHLRRLTQRGELADLRGRLQAVFSSGGPLPAETAHAIESALGLAPVEVFGSTETGGVATRRQTRSGDPSPAWETLGPVDVRVDPASGCLRVASPFVSVGTEQPDGTLELDMGDRAELHADGRFQLLGRADRLVKIGEKRLALPDMESQLQIHPIVSEAALVDVDRGGDARVAAVLVLSAEGRKLLARDGRRAVAAALAEHLAPNWDRVLLPRVWRIVDSLPRDERGKLPRSALLAVAGERPRGPRILAEQRGEASLRRELEVPDDLAQLEGHFPEHPVVPGVAQLGWVLDAARVLLGRPLRPRAVEVLKFKAALRPGQRAVLEVRADAELAEASRVRFTLATSDGEVASGRIDVDPS